MRKTVVPAISFLGVLLIAPAEADSVLPGQGFTGNRYAELWENSPFAVATPEVAASQDYDLVGLAEFDGVAYVSLVDKQTQEHFVLTNEKPMKNLRLISVHPGVKGGSAVIERDGIRLVLEEQNLAPAMAPIAADPPAVEASIPPPTFRVLPHTQFYPPLVLSSQSGHP
jgi:hypothetical protein